MKKYYLIITLGVVFALSCNSDSSDKQDEGVNENHSKKEQKLIVEKNEKDTEQNQQQPEIDEKFKVFLSKFAKVSLPYKENPIGNEAFAKIPIDEQVTYLSKPEKLSATDLNKMADYTDFYYISNPLNTNMFHAIVYGRFEMSSTYYFLCTYDNDGNLISNIDFAAYELIGAGPQAGQEYNTKGMIDKNFEITVKSDEELRKYKIQDDGKIIKID